MIKNDKFNKFKILVPFCVNNFNGVGKNKERERLREGMVMCKRGNMVIIFIFEFFPSKLFFII